MRKSARETVSKQVRGQSVAADGGGIEQKLLLEKTSGVDFADMSVYRQKHALDVENAVLSRKITLSYQRDQMNEAEYLQDIWKNPSELQDIVDRIESKRYSLRDLFLFKCFVDRNDRFIEFIARRLYPEVIQINNSWRPLVFANIVPTQPKTEVLAQPSKKKSGRKKRESQNLSSATPDLHDTL